jgi:hypothetical protein
LQDWPYDPHRDRASTALDCTVAAAGLIMRFYGREADCPKSAFVEACGHLRPLCPILYKSTIVSPEKRGLLGAPQIHLSPVRPSTQRFHHYFGSYFGSQKPIQSP